MSARHATSVAIVLTAVTACGGAKEQDVLQGTSTSSSSSSSSSSSGGASSSSGTTASGGPTSSGGLLDAGNCVPEQEPNDNKDKANVLETSRCGTIDPVGDVDFLTFTLKPTSQSLALKYDGKVTLTVTVEGAQTVVLGGGGSQNVPFVRGAPYYVEIQSIDKSRPAWRVDLVETP